MSFRKVLSPKKPTITICIDDFGGGGGVQLSKVNFKLSNLSPELKFPSLVGVGGGGVIGIYGIWC